MKTGMSDSGGKKISKMLYHFLSDTYMIYLKTQNFHWNVKGPNFFSLHILFEKQYTELAEALDEIAERVQALGSFVDASFSGFKHGCCLKEERRPLQAKKMLEQLLKDHEMVIRCAREIAVFAEEEKDQATGDLMARRLGVHEKFAWMIRSHLLSR